MNTGIELPAAPPNRPRPLRRWLDAVAVVLMNPVVVRDLRAQMRGTRSYWYMGAYLLLLGTLTVCGYAVSTGQSPLHAPGVEPRDIAELQGIMQGFYYYLFFTLAALITLIAPALTAASIVGERQRQSLDLLVATPLTAGQMLLGKLLSSVAFLGLLLALSLPASALCILFGGATLGDLFRIYVTLAVDGVVIAAIGLYFSCACSTNLVALVWSYLATVGFLMATLIAYVMNSVTDGHGASVPPTLLLGVGALNPLVAVMPDAGRSVAIGLVPVPTVVVTLLVAALAVRLLLTAAAYRLGTHGAAFGPSLRRQTLLVVFLLAYLGMQCGLTVTLSSETNAAGEAPMPLVLGAFSMFLQITPFLAGLFVPVRAAQANTPETPDPDAPGPSGLYDVRCAFQPVARGAMPYFHLIIVVALAATFLADWQVLGRVSGQSAAALGEVSLYVAALGLLYRAVSRLMATVSGRVSQARGLAFVTFLMILAAPAVPIACTSGSGHWYQNPLATLWLLYPFTFDPSAKPLATVAHFMTWMPLSAAEAVFLSIPLLALAAARARRTNAAPTPAPEANPPR
jgi:hypothetical protein